VTAMEESAAPTTLTDQHLSLWRNPDFLKFWLGETLSLYGTQITTLALPLTAVLVFNAGPEEVGLLRFLQLVPYLAFALLFGVLVDRMRQRPIMIFANTVRMVLIGLVSVLAVLDRLDLPVLLVIAFGIGTASVLFDVSWMSYLPALIKHRKHLVEANAKIATTSASADAAGPGVAGVLVGALTAPVVMAVDAASYLVSVVSLILIRTPEKPPSRTGAERRLIPELVEGLRWVFGNVYLRFLAFVGASCNFFTIATATMFLLYAVRDKGIEPEELGLIFSLGAVGGLTGSLVSGWLIRRLTVGTAYLGSLTAVFLGPLLIPLAGGPQLFTQGMFVASFFLTYAGLAVSNVLILSLRQTVTPPALMGRMNAAMRTLMFGGGSIGGPASGLLAGAIGLHGALWVIGIGAAAMLVPVALSPVSRLREMAEVARC